jgi:transcription initiation factor TFIIH subunit 3
MYNTNTTAGSITTTTTTMDKVDASTHYQGAAGIQTLTLSKSKCKCSFLTSPLEDKPSLLVVVLDTNPFAWQSLQSELPLQTALSHILLFLNAHLSFSHANQVAVIASHTKTATFLYPDPTAEPANPPNRDANKYRLFASIEHQVQASFQHLLSSTAPESLAETNETTMAGALSLALAYINRVCNAGNLSDNSGGGDGAGGGERPGEARTDTASMTARILVVSVSGDLANQYVSVMNSIFAAQRQHVPIDICKIAGDTVFLQQASDSTNGIYMHVQHPSALLQYLLVRCVSF